MTRIFVVAWALLTFAAGVSAGETAVRLRVQAMRLPRPALKYQLLPELWELKPGNPAQNYLKCFMEQRTFFYGTKAAADRARYQTMALADLPLEEVSHYGGFALRQADRAARLDTLDWEALESIQKGGIDSLPGEIGPLQVLMSALHVRFRGELRGKRFDDAVRSAKTMLALCRHLGEHPTEVASLVGLWSASLTLGTIEEMVQQPGCPNLYWALTDLPDPLVDVRQGARGQGTIVAAELRLLHDDAPMTETELATFVGRLSGVLSFAREQAGRAPGNVRTVLRDRAKDPERVGAARGRMVEAGCAQDRINKFLSLQVILLDEKREYELERDERNKLLGLPLWQIGSSAGEKCSEHGLFADLLPDVNKLRLAQVKLQQQIAMLRHVEALRTYAALHDGVLPANVCDLSVPPPIDPITAKPFDYQVEAATAHIRGGLIPSADSRAGYSLHYEVTVQTESKGRP